MRHLLSVLINFAICAFVAAFLAPTGDPFTYIIYIAAIFPIGIVLYVLGMNNGARSLERAIVKAKDPVDEKD